MIVRTIALLDGMILARDVHDASGRVVARAGMAVDANLRARFARMKVARVEIRSESESAERGPSPAGPGRHEDKAAADKSDSVIIQGHLMKIAHMFGEYRDDPLMRELCRLAIKCAQERLISV